MENLLTTLVGGPAKLCLPDHLNRPNLRRDSASEYLERAWGLEVATSTLAKMACRGGGPAFSKAGRTPYYAVTELDRWAAERLGTPLRSTSDDGRH